MGAAARARSARRDRRPAAHRACSARRSWRRSACSGSPSTTAATTSRPAALQPAGQARRERGRRPDRPARRSARAGPGWRDQRARQPARRCRRLSATRSGARRSKGGPVNAFTLPGGILVFYSDLIDQAQRRHAGGGRAGARDGPRRHFIRSRAGRQFGIDRSGRRDWRLLRPSTVAWAATCSGAAQRPRFERDADATAWRCWRSWLRADGVRASSSSMIEQQPKDTAASQASGRAIRRLPSGSPRPGGRRPAAASATPNGPAGAPIWVLARQPAGVAKPSIAGDRQPAAQCRAL